LKGAATWTPQVSLDRLPAQLPVNANVVSELKRFAPDESPYDIETRKKDARNLREGCLSEHGSNQHGLECFEPDVDGHRFIQISSLLVFPFVLAIGEGTCVCLPLNPSRPGA
jgi:hypothetical protein